METGNKQQMALILKQYKLKDGSCNFPSLFNIPSVERIPVLAEKDFRKTNMLIVGALTMAFKSLNLKNGLNEIQILDISEAIIDTSVEDNLGLEDVVLFLQGLVRGKYGTSLENMNTPKFLQIFEVYRQERHENYIQLKENLHLQYKGLGDATRTCQGDDLEQHFARLGDTISSLKSELRETKKENNTLKQIDKF